MMSKEILVVYPQVHQTKMAVYRTSNVIFLKTIKHKQEELDIFKDPMDQVDFRTKAVMKELKENDLNLQAINVVVARGGLIKPLKVAGVYEVNNLMIEHLQMGYQGTHETNMGGIIAQAVAKQLPNARAFLADPVVVDELDDIARVTGHPDVERKSIFHALNHKYIARKYAKSKAKCYYDMRLIVVHIGSGGISIGAHKGGRVVDVNQAFDGAGPFSLSRTGTLPIGRLVKACFSGKYTEAQLMKMITKEGGIFAHLGTSNIHEIFERIEDGDKKAAFYIEAMAYNVAKHVGSMAAVLDFKVDAILLSGSIFNYQFFTNYLSNKLKSVADISLFPEVNDLDALAWNSFLALKGEIDVNIYE
ncbi:MAG: butyrate kinase [Bacteroidetes bacterium 4572_77]|nr:MAG: butyrate kinase [Bacteroidetes bacterium 4572_77]